jgi:hypothetical protein
MQRDIDLTIKDVIVEGIRSYALSQFSAYITFEDTHESPLPQDNQYRTIQWPISNSYIQTDGKRGVSWGKELRCSLVLLGIVHRPRPNLFSGVTAITTMANWSLLSNNEPPIVEKPYIAQHRRTAGVAATTPNSMNPARLSVKLPTNALCLGLAGYDFRTCSSWVNI